MTRHEPGGQEACGPGSVVASRFRLEDLLDERAGARFWRATDLTLARNVAIHVISAHDPRAARRPHRGPHLRDRQRAAPAPGARRRPGGRRRPRRPRVGLRGLAGPHARRGAARPPPRRLAGARGGPGDRRHPPPGGRARPAAARERPGLRLGLGQADRLRRRRRALRPALGRRTRGRRGDPAQRPRVRRPQPRRAALHRAWSAGGRGGPRPSFPTPRSTTARCAAPARSAPACPASSTRCAAASCAPRRARG